MSTNQAFATFISTHLDGLKRLRNGVPEGLPGQLEELADVLATFDAAVAQIVADGRLSATGKAERLREARDAAQKSVEAWRSARTAGLDAQITVQRASLRPQGDKPGDLAVQTMAERLATFDPLEIAVLYGDATDAERRVIESAVAAIGRQPRKRGDQLVWEELLSPELVAAAQAERAEATNPAGAATLRDLEANSGNYTSLASAASGLLRDALPACQEAPNIPQA